VDLRGSASEELAVDCVGRPWQAAPEADAVRGDLSARHDQARERAAADPGSVLQNTQGWMAHTKPEELTLVFGRFHDRPLISRALEITHNP